MNRKNKRRNRNQKINKNVKNTVEIEKNSSPEILDKETYLKELEEKIAKTETKETVERICLKVLEENVYEERKKYKDILSLEIDIIEEFRKKAYDELKDKFEEAEKLRQNYFMEINKQETLVLRKKNELKRKELEIETKLREESFSLRKRAAKEKEEIDEIRTNLEEEIARTISRTKELDEEYEIFKENLEKEYKEKDASLLNKFNLKSTELEEEYNRKSREFSDYVENKKKELEEEKNLLEKTFKEKEKDFNNYVIQEEEKLKKEKEEVNIYKKDIIEKVDEQIADKRQAFIDEMIYLNSDIRNELDRKEWEINKKEAEFKNKAKQKELSLFKASKEYEEKVDNFNKEVEKFNNSKKTFLNQHHWLHILKRKIKEHLFGSLIVLAFIMIISFVFLYSNEYKFFKNNFIASSINRYLDNKITESEYSFSLNTKNSVLAKFTQLDGLNVDVNTSKNNSFSENYEKIILNSGENNFVFERFYKNNNFIMKTPNFNQYIIYDDINEAGYEYKEDEFNESVLNALKRSLSKNKNKNYTDVSKINVNGNDSFFDFINSSFLLSKDYEYFYTIESKDDVLFKEIFTNILGSKNYSNFILEESNIAKKLDKANEFKEIEDIIKGILENSKVNRNIINLKISKDLELSNIDITFNLEYKDSSMASSVPLIVTIRCSLENINEDISLEKSQFRMNSVKFENLNTKKD